jgi:hypothetical protein
MLLTPNLTPYPYKLALAKGQDGSLTSTVGLEAYQRTTTDGSIFIMAPSLNFFIVVQRTPVGEISYHDIDVSEKPPKELFEPPAGVVVAGR